MFEKIRNKKLATGATILAGFLATACGANNKFSANCGEGQSANSAVFPDQNRNQTTAIGGTTLRSLGDGEFSITYDVTSNTDNHRIRTERGDFRISSDSQDNVIVESVGSSTHRLLLSDNNQHFQITAERGIQHSTALDIASSCTK